MLRSANIILVASSRETSKQDNESRKEQEDHSRKLSPHANGVFRLASTIVLAAVDVVLQDSEGDEVRRHHYDGERPRQGCDQRCEKCAADAAAEGEEEGDECHAADDGVQDHDASESLGGVFGGMVECCVVDVGDYLGGIVTDVRLCAIVLVLLGTCDIENAIPECPKCD